MASKKNVSKLSDHRLYRKQGKVVAPLNDGLVNQLTLSSWTRERMPEFLWLGLVLMEHGRDAGFEKAGRILLKISKEAKSLSHPKMSEILALPSHEQRAIYQIILNEIEPYVLSPLTTIYHAPQYPEFNLAFNVREIRFEQRLQRLNQAIKTYSPHQSHEATDLRFLALSLFILGGRFHIASHLTTTTEAFSKYPYISHDDERMQRYRPSIRAAEVALSAENDSEFGERFWNKIGLITRCSPMIIMHNENETNYQSFIEQVQKILDYVLNSYKQASLIDDKFDVILGSLVYALKVFSEVNNKSLGNSVLGRHAARTIIEILIILKYLLKRENENPNIWEEYKLYGLGKYKLVLLKARENDLVETTHFAPPIVDMLVNEIKWEEFIDVDLTYFDKQGIREKSIEVGEKYIYDLFYDYDSSFAHGLWGAIREAAMLKCDTASHQHNAIPDVQLAQTLPDVKADCFDILKKLLNLLKQNYAFPDELMPSE